MSVHEARPAPVGESRIEDEGPVAVTAPLTPMQFGLAFESAREGWSGVNLEQVVCRFTDEHIDSGRLEQAWRAVQARHDMLRASIDLQHPDGPRQCVHDRSDVVVSALDWTGLDEAEQERALREWLAADRAGGVDLTDPGALRVAHMALGAQRSVMVWTGHHALLDGRSIAAVVEEVLQRYDELASSGVMARREAPPSFFEHVHAVHRTDDGAAREFFAELLVGHAGSPGAPGAAVQVVGDDDSEPHQELEHRTPPDLLDRLTARAGAADVTLGALLLATWSILESRYSSSTDVVFGTTRAGRHATPDAEHMVGCLITTVPIRLRPEPEASVDELLRAARAFQLDVRPHEHAALVDIRSWSDVVGEQPLVSTTVVFERDHIDARLRSRGGRPGRQVSVLDQTSSPLVLAACIDDGLLLKFEYDTSMYRPGAVQDLVRHLVNLLESIAASDATTSIGSLEMLGDVERTRLLDERNPTRSTATTDDRYVDRFEAQVALHGTDVAVEEMDGSARLTYRELDERANRLAHLLVGAGASQEQPVALCLTRSIDFVVSMLAVLKAGAAYLPLDPTYPVASLRHMLVRSGARLVVTSSTLAAQVPTGDPVDPHGVLVLDRLVAELDAAPTTPPTRAAATPEDLAYVIFTSGTTGPPKGVMVADRSLVDFCDAVEQRYELTSSDRILQFSSLSFDVSIEEMLPSFAVGATVVLRSDELSSSMGSLVEATEQSGLSVLNLPSAIWHALVEHLDASGGRLGTSLRLVVVGGEKVARGAYDMWAGIHPEVRWLNGYGPTETTVTCTSFDPAGRYRVGSGDELPIGRPMANARAYLLDGSGTSLVPDGQVGELWIGGSGVAVGYLGEAQLTAERFRPDPFVEDPTARMYRTGDRARWLPQGDLEFLGRADRQIKLRGFRIEPGEVEHALEQHPDVRQAFVSLRPDGAGGDRLVAWVVPSHARPADPATVLDLVRHRLPSHTVPSALVVVDELPRTPAGKVDVDVLPVPIPSDPGGSPVGGAARADAPANDDEVALCRLFGETLRSQRPIGAEESFFDLGGHSLLAVRLTSRIEADLGVRISLATLYGAPTPRALAGCLDHSTSDDPVYLSRIQPAGTLPPLYGIHVLGSNGAFFRPLAARLGDDQPVYGLSIGDPDENTPTAVEEIARRYVEQIERHQPDGALSLAAVSLGGFVAFEVAQQLRSRGRDVSVLALFDSEGPGGRPSVSAGRRAGIHLGKLRAQGVHHLVSSAQRRLTVAKSFAATASIRLRRAVGMPTPDALWTHRFVLANTAAAESYVARPYPGPITVFHASDEVFDDSDAIRTALGWAGVAAGPIEVVEVPGGHLSMLEEPHVAALAEALRSAMASPTTGSPETGRPEPGTLRP